jgi:hypothetical protein
MPKATTHRLAESLLKYADSPIRFVTFGPFVLTWTDKGKNPALVTIPTEEILGND